MKIYIACPMDRVLVAHDWARRLEAAGFSVVSSWHARVSFGDRDVSAVGERRAALLSNLADLATAEIVVAHTATGRPRCTWGELAYAYSLSIPVLLQAAKVGAPNACILDAHPLCVKFAEDADLERALRRLSTRIARMKASRERALAPEAEV